jgi:hypothetical protein
MARFTKIGITAGKTVDAAKASPELQKAIGKGIGNHWADFMELKKRAGIMGCVCTNPALKSLTTHGNFRLSNR